MIELTNEPIDIHHVTESVQHHSAGAVVSFLGTVREFTHGAQTEYLEYEAFTEMAIASMHELAEEVRGRFPVLAVSIVHRTGRLDLGDVSVAIAVSCPHRAQAFDAARWLIDTLKERTPIWKKEHYSDGREEWQHPQQAVAKKNDQAGPL
jgi:molybdopterin synthase catalytic subunit